MAVSELLKITSVPYLQADLRCSWRLRTVLVWCLLSLSDCQIQLSWAPFSVVTSAVIRVLSPDRQQDHWLHS